MTLAQVVKDVINVGISPQRKRSMAIERKEVMTLLLELTQSSLEFHSKYETAQRARVRHMSVITF